MNTCSFFGNFFCGIAGVLLFHVAARVGSHWLLHVKMRRHHKLVGGVSLCKRCLRWIPGPP